MNKFLNIATTSKLAKFFLVAISVCALLYFPPTENEINNAVKKVYYHLGPKENPDSNLVLIHISENDIKQLGSWPLKRSYYALIIKKLNELKVKTIGIEVYLSPKQSFQSLYNNLLNVEISNAGNVVLSSLVSGLKKTKTGFSCDSVLYPEPYYFENGVNTGHLNFLRQRNYYTK